MTTSSRKRRSSPSRKTSPPETSSTDDSMSSSVSAVISKTDSQESENLSWGTVGSTYLNPFVHRLNIDNNVELAKIYVLTVLLVPLRIAGCLLSLLSAWIFACIGLHGLTVDEINKQPITGWRSNVRYLVASSMRMLFAAGSFHHITYKGERASPKEAPILVVAPHSSYVDSIIIAATSPTPAIVAKRDTSEIPILGKIINYAQPIYVQREDPNSRQNTIQEIVRRAKSRQNWSQVAIFSEGTCTNRKALIKFKSGAFYPGVPVQPVLLKYPNKYDTFTWTWDGPAILRLFWLTMASFYNHCEIEYLPVYVPSEEEKADPNLYASNVRKVMASSLGVPTSEYSYEDVILMTRAQDLKVPISSDIVEIERTLHVLGLLTSETVSELTNKFKNIPNSNKLDVITFSELLNINLDNPSLHHLYSILDYRQVGTVSLKNFLLSCIFCKYSNVETIEFLKAIKNIYAASETMTHQEFTNLLKHNDKLKPKQIEQLFAKIDQANKGSITFDDFDKYCRKKAEYKFLYKKYDYIRRKEEAYLDTYSYFASAQPAHQEISPTFGQTKGVLK